MPVQSNRNADISVNELHKYLVRQARLSIKSSVLIPDYVKGETTRVFNRDTICRDTNRNRWNPFEHSTVKAGTSCGYGANGLGMECKKHTE